MNSRRKSATVSPAASDQTAEHLHAAAIHLLRTVRLVDQETGMSPARLSLLSVLVFGGPQSQRALAEAEGVSAPTISVTVRDLERLGLVDRKEDQHDKRLAMVRATPLARSLVLKGRQRRLAVIDTALKVLSKEDRLALQACIPALQRLVQGLAILP